MELEYSQLGNSDKKVDIETWFNKKRFKSELTFRVKEGITGIAYSISFSLLEDNYFKVWALMPYNSRYYPNGFWIEDFNFLIDGWDGFDEWATKTTPFKKRTELFDLFTIPLNDYNSKEIISQSFKNTILMNYLTIRDWGSKRVYCKIVQNVS